jgi:hypothetical protein
VFKVDSAKEYAHETARLVSELEERRRAMAAEYELVLSRAKEKWEADAETRLKEEQQKMAKQVHDLEQELQSLPASQHHDTQGSINQENLFQCIIPGTRSTTAGEQKTGRENRGIIPLSEIEEMTAHDVAGDSGSELSSLSALIRSVPDMELPPVSQAISETLPAHSAAQKQPAVVAKAGNPANSKRKYEPIASPASQGQGDRAPESGPSELQTSAGGFANVFDRLEQQRSQPPGAQPSFESRDKGPNAGRETNRSTATEEMSERPSKFVRTSRPGPGPLDEQTGRAMQMSPKLTSVPDSPPHLRRDRQSKAPSTRKSRRIKQMDIMRAKFEEDGPSRQGKA